MLSSNNTVKVDSGRVGYRDIPGGQSCDSIPDAGERMGLPEDIPQSGVETHYDHVFSGHGSFSVDPRSSVFIRVRKRFSLSLMNDAGK
jgi:hypothetical protein